MDRGVDAAPALVVGEEWLVAGPRSVDEYREILERYAQVRHGSLPRASCTDGHRTARTECARPRARRARPHLALRACPRDLRGFPAASSLGMRVANTLRDKVASLASMNADGRRASIGRAPRRRSHR